MNSVAARSRPAFMLSWLRRLERQAPFILSSLQFNRVSLLHLPAECFIEYQLRAQQLRPDSLVATAAYGDCGCWYMPTAQEFPLGGYEVGASFCDPSIDGALTGAMQRLLA